MSDLDDLEEIAEQNNCNYNPESRSRAGCKPGAGPRTPRAARSRGRFRRLKKRPITLPGQQESACSGS